MPETHTRSAGPPTGGRLVAVIAGALVATVATMLLMAGGGLMWVDGKKDDDGYFQTASKRFATSTYAVASDDLDIDDLPSDDGVYGKVRLKVRSNDGAPVFVGIARTNDVDAYLRGAAHATLTDVEFSPFRPSYRNSGGDRRPAAPGTENIWTASATGTGTQTLDWKVDDGNWSVVVMNADGSPGVDAAVSAGANVPIVDDLAWGVSIAGFALLLVGGGLIAGGLVRPRRRQSLPA